MLARGPFQLLLDGVMCMTSILMVTKVGTVRKGSFRCCDGDGELGAIRLFLMTTVVFFITMIVITVAV